jgi:hypothetical protein
MKVLGEEIAVKENLVFSFNRYLIWWLILLVTMVFDYVTTIFFVSRNGIGAEANMVVKWLIEDQGVAIGVFIGKLLQLISVIIIVSLHRRLGNMFLLIVILLNCWAVVLNTF